MWELACGKQEEEEAVYEDEVVVEEGSEGEQWMSRVCRPVQGSRLRPAEFRTSTVRECQYQRAAQHRHPERKAKGNTPSYSNVCIA